MRSTATWCAAAVVGCCCCCLLLLHRLRTAGGATTASCLAAMLQPRRAWQAPQIEAPLSSRRSAHRRDPCTRLLAHPCRWHQESRRRRLRTAGGPTMGTCLASMPQPRRAWQAPQIGAPGCSTVSLPHTAATGAPACWPTRAFRARFQADFLRTAGSSRDATCLVRTRHSSCAWHRPRGTYLSMQTVR